MSNIAQVELSDTFNKQRQVINEVVNVVNQQLPISGGNGISVSGGSLNLNISGDGLSFNGLGALVGNDAYPNLMTQVVLGEGASSTVPTTITSTTIDFPAFKVIFDTKVYYGKKISDFTVVNVPATQMTVQAGVDGAVFVYVDNNGEIHQSLNSVSAENSSTQCLLGSYFRLNNQIQSGSWAYTPWNGATSKDSRFAIGGSVSGGLLVASSTSSLSRMGMSVLLEGVNASTSIYTPNNIIYQDESLYSTKELWPGYDASVSDTSVLDTTHIYNMTTETVDDISAIDGYIVLIPGIVAATGQDVYLMGMSEKEGNNYTQIYSTMSDAIASIYSIQVSLGNVASRVLWLGQSIVVKIGATDYSDQSQLKIVGSIPNMLGAYSSTSSGGSGSRVSGITIKSDGSVIGDVDQKTSLNFDSNFTILNTSANEVSISTNLTAATQSEVNSGTNTDKFVTPKTLKDQNYLATIEYVGNILQQKSSTGWPQSTSVTTWPHTILVSTAVDFTLPTTLPTYVDSILTWEVVISNTGSSSINITWPSVYQPFNNEVLATSLDAGTSVFFMMRRYSNNYVLVSKQGQQISSLI